MKTKRTKSLGELLSDAEDTAIGGYVSGIWEKLPTSTRKRYSRMAEFFLASLPKPKPEITSPAVATKAARALRSKRTSKAGKAIAASALTQARNRRGGRK